MYGIPEDADFSFMVGKVVEQLCIGLYQVQLHLRGDVSISIGLAFEHSRGEEVLSAAEANVVKQIGPPAATMTSLLGSSVAAVTNEGGKALLISFSNGETVRLRDLTHMYESFQITTAEGIFIIV